MENRFPGGSWPVMLTPFTEDNKIDYDGLKELVDWYIKNGVSGMFAVCQSSEMFYLSLEERVKYAAKTVEFAAGRVPVFVHVGAWNLKDTIELAQHAEKIGADGIGVVTPAFYKLSDHGLVDFYVEVAHSVSEDFPVYMYAIPQNAINDVNATVCEEVAKQCLNVLGIKYSYPDFTKLQQFMMVKDQTFSVLVGPDHLFEAVCAVGGDGVVSGNAMIVREHYVAIWDAVQKKDYDMATKYQRRTNILNATMCEINNIAAYKVILKEEGIIKTTKMRRPMENLTLEQEKALLNRMRELDYKKVLV